MQIKYSDRDCWDIPTCRKIALLSLLFVYCAAAPLALRASEAPIGREHAATATRQANSNWSAIGLAFTQIIIEDEKKYHATHGRYATDLDLSKSGRLGAATWKMTLKFGRDIFEKYPWDFQIDTSADGQRYLLIVHSKQQCQRVFFSNQVGQIYEGEKVGCR